MNDVPVSGRETPRSTAFVSWNAWWEAGAQKTPGYAPVANLKPSTTVTLVLDLSRVAYSAPNVGTTAASRTLEERRRELAKKLNAAEHLTLRTLLVFDAEFFDLEGDRVKEREVDVARLAPSAWPTDAAPTLVAQAKATSLWTVLFPLRTRARAGSTAVAEARRSRKKGTAGCLPASRRGAPPGATPTV